VIDSYFKDIINKIKVSDAQNKIHFIDANESSKGYSSVESILNWYSLLGLNKESRVLAIGGGIVQDIVTFTTSIFHRGIKWIYVPTTLLSQSDSCVGGKCGINLNGKKNQVGTFYPPESIIISNHFIESLSESEILSGLGEILKMSLTGEGQFWNRMKEFLDTFSIKNSEYLEIIKLSIYAKKLVIEIDEFENDLRRILNYGHTFGHAIEAASNYKIPHGIGVILGIKTINLYGHQLGITPIHLVKEISYYCDKILNSYSETTKFDWDKAIQAVSNDKKMGKGKITFVLIQSPGDLIQFQIEFDKKLLKELNSIIGVLK
jgi:3-dehydroquinate synthase